MEIINYKNLIDSSKSKDQLEREWRNAQLESTDSIVPVTDHPKHAEYLSYRQELRDYPQQEDFPNGTRPIKP